MCYPIQIPPPPLIPVLLLLHHLLLHQRTPLLPRHIHQHLLFPLNANANDVEDLIPVKLDPNLIGKDIGMNNGSESTTVEIVEVVVVILRHPPPLLVNLLLLLQPAAAVAAYHLPLRVQVPLGPLAVRHPLLPNI